MTKPVTVSPQATRRATRSSSSTLQSQSPCRSTSNKADTTPHPSPKPTFNDLVISQDQNRRPLTIESLISQFPGRRAQIQHIIRLLGPQNSPTLPLFLYGPPSTGKTSVLLETLNHLNRPFVYTSCRSHYTPRILFESILNQLSLIHPRDSSAKRCDKPSDFANLLRESLIRISNDSIYLVFDNLELVRGWEKSCVLLPFLFNLYDVMKMADKVGIVFVSNSSPDTYYSSSNAGYVESVPVYFPEYTEQDLRMILMRNHQAEQRNLYSSFLDIVLRPFCRVTRRVDELSTVFPHLFRKFCEPLSDTGILPNEEVKRRLFAHFQPHFAPALNEAFQIRSLFSLDDESNKEETGKCDRRKSGGSDDFLDMDFHMSTSAKYLLISAFLASRNPATLDAFLFDSTGGSDSRKRKRKASEKSLEQKEMAEEELLMKGPGTFPLERLLAIFQCITSVAEISLEEENHGNDVSRVEGGHNRLMNDVLLQLSSLCNANFIIKGASCPLEGSTRYRSTVSEDLALQVYVGSKEPQFPFAELLVQKITTPVETSMIGSSIKILKPNCPMVNILPTAKICASISLTCAHVTVVIDVIINVLDE